jgi:putative transposase
MPRPLRKDRPGNVHHIYVRGVAKAKIALDAVDFRRTLNLLERTVSRFDLTCHAWALLPNHNHLLVTSQKGNVSEAMRWFGSQTATTFNARHARSGHLYQGRFGSKLVKHDVYFFQLARYLALNPVRAGLCAAPEDWLWSSYSATASLSPWPRFLDARAILDGLGSVDGYVRWVADAVGADALDERGALRPAARPSLTRLIPDDSDRAIAVAYFQHGYSMIAIAEHLGTNRWQISRRLAKNT